MHWLTVIEWRQILSQKFYIQRFKDKTIDNVVLIKTTNEVYIHYPSQNYSDEKNQSDLN